MTTDKTIPDSHAIPTLMPWYVHVVGGHALTGLFPWLLVARQLNARLKEPLAWAVLIVNILIFIAFCVCGIKTKWEWRHLLIASQAFNLAWSLGAWIFQYHLFGPAPKRYFPREWKSWILPVVTALAIACCLSILVAVFPIITRRMDLETLGNIMDRRVILWDFFQYIPWILPYGLLVGGWWAGEGRRFSPGHVMTYLSGLILFVFGSVVTIILFQFLFYKGQLTASYTDASPLTAGFTGWARILVSIEEYDQICLAVIPLLLGVSPRIRDFWKRAFAMIPIICISLTPLGFYEASSWGIIQGQIVHEMTAPEADTRQRAFGWMETLLVRYPDYDRWPEMALALAKHRYNTRDITGARDLYEQVESRFSHIPRWNWETAVARAALGSTKFGSASRNHAIALPLVGYESYLTPNWMTLLQISRYWKGKDIPESEVLIQLKLLSRSDDEIDLSPITGLVELDDSARNLGYELIIIPAGAEAATSLIQARIPAILPIYDSFYLLYGMDDTRAVIMSCLYEKISDRLRTGDKNEVREILSVEREGAGESVKLLTHIANQAYTEIPLSFWESKGQLDGAPLMAVVCPPIETDRVAKALGADPATLKRQSNGYLAAYIGLLALDTADPVKCVEWARVSRRLIDAPLALHLGHLAERFLNTRDKLTRSRLPVEKQFPELAAVSNYFKEDDVRAFLDAARQRFTKDQAANRLPWMIRRQLRDFLDRSDPHDMAELTRLSRQDVDAHPANRENWLYLCDLYELADDDKNLVWALEGALDAGPWDNEIAIQLAFRYVKMGRKEAAKTTMARIAPEKVRYNAHYFFCKAAMAEWKHKNAQALKYYETAIDMRRYIPLYHLSYGKLLLREGKIDAARNALKWAMRIDGKGPIEKEAETILKETEHHG